MLDILSFGELLQRNTVTDCCSVDKIDKSNPNYEKCYGGTECNVLIGLSNFGIKGTYVSSFVKNDDGLGAKKFINSFGINIIDISSRKDKNMAKYWFIPNGKNRGASTLYDRKDSIVTYLTIDDLKKNGVFNNEAKIFHTSGIALALNWKGKSNTCIDFIKEAHNAGKMVSFDFNYRPNLWESEAKAKKAFLEIVDYLDIVLLSDYDLARFLGFEGTQRQMAVAFQEKFKVKYLIVRNRKEVSPYIHKVKALIIDENMNIFESKDSAYFQVDERVGGGDSFAAGILTGIFKGYSLAKILQFGLECFKLKHRIPGDTFNTDKFDINKTIEERIDPNRMKICIAVDLFDIHYEKMFDELSKYATVIVKELSFTNLREFDIFVGKKLSEQQLATANKLKAVFAYKTGVDNFPLSKLAERNIKLYNSHINASVIAKYAFGLCLSLTNKITEFDKKLRRGVWMNKDDCWADFFNMKVGIVGFGAIGQEINKILVNNNIETYTINRGKEYKDVKVVDSLENLCVTTDLLIICLPSTSDTDNLINKDILKLLNGKYIVNVGRQNCINETDLYNSLKSHELAGAALDAWDKKPINGNNKFLPFEKPLNKLNNIILSPHQAMKTKDGHQKYVEDTTENIIEFIKTKKAKNLVNLKKGY